jgi:hypothetical protein
MLGIVMGRKQQIAASVGALGLLVPSIARADGIDVDWLLTRSAGWERHPIRALVLMVILMLVNYGLNYLVIGLPAAKALQRQPSSLTRGLVWYTLLAQGIDRIAFVISIVIGMMLASTVGIRGEAVLGLGAMIGLGLNFIIAGAGIGGLALATMTKRWKVPAKPAQTIAIRAGILTNPSWIIMLTPLIDRLT